MKHVKTEEMHWIVRPFYHLIGIIFAVFWILFSDPRKNAIKILKEMKLDPEQLSQILDEKRIRW